MEGIFAPWHIAIVLVIALLIFGPKRLPQMGHSLGKSITGFRQGLQDAKGEFSGAMNETQAASEPTTTHLAASSGPGVPEAAAAPVVGPVLAEPVAEITERPTKSVGM